MKHVHSWRNRKRALARLLAQRRVWKISREDTGLFFEVNFDRPGGWDAIGSGSCGSRGEVLTRTGQDTTFEGEGRELR